MSAILKNISLAHEHQRFHDAFDVISLSQSAVFPHCQQAREAKVERKENRNLRLPPLFAAATQAIQRTPPVHDKTGL